MIFNCSNTLSKVSIDFFLRFLWANISEIADLIYFVKKLYKSLKVPVNRISPESAYNDGMSILREELKFANFIRKN